MKQSRRKFVALAGTASAGMAFTGMNFSPEPKAETIKEGFDIKFYATQWGFSGSVDAFCKQVRSAGYDGVEAWVTRDRGAEELLEALSKYDLSFGALTGSGGATIEEHLDSYEQNLELAIATNPDFINNHAGKDYLSFEESLRLIELGVMKAKESDIPVYQETHRGKMLFAAHVCEKFIDANQDLKLTLDISHWCAVAETLLGDQKVAVEKALRRTGHIHSRIGHQEGPQVPDPREPMWEKAKEAHYGWWDQVVAMKREKGELLTVTTEFGPPNYMWTDPYTEDPLSNQWEINVHMMNEWKKRYL